MMAKAAGALYEAPGNNHRAGDRGIQTMLALHHSARLICSAVVLVAIGTKPAALAADKDTATKDGKIAGIMFDVDLKANWITVKADGEEEPVKYLFNPSNKKLANVLGKTIFGACRVQLTYKTEGNSRQLVSIKRQIFKESGTVTGTVVKVHNDFWIELKPKVGFADAYAPGANYNDKEFMEKLKALQPGESVTITFTTDFERHRITTLRKNPTSPSKTEGSSGTALAKP
jgi:hypothetical protein